MPYDPIGNYNQIQWDANGPYWMTGSGARSYIPPATASTWDGAQADQLQQWAAGQGASDANPGGARPSGGVFSNPGTWNATKGQFDQGVNWGNVLAMGAGALIGAPLVGAAFGAGSGAGVMTGPTIAQAGGSAAGIGGGAGAGLAAAGGGSTIGKFLMGIAPQLINTATGIYGANKQATAQDRATQAQIDAANRAAELQAQSSRDALDFMKGQAAQDQANWAWAQNNTINEFEGTQANDIAKFEGRERNLSPYRGIGQSATNTIGALLGLPKVDVPITHLTPTQLTRPGGGTIGGAMADTSQEQAYFNGLFPDASLTPQQLAGKEADLNAKGWKVVRNAAGTAGKVQLPNGMIVDVIQGAGSGLNRRQWLT